MKWLNRTFVVAAVVGAWVLQTGHVVHGALAEKAIGNCSGYTDCNGNGVDDDCDASCAFAGTFCVGGFPAIAGCDSGYFASCGTSANCNGNHVPDECELNNNDCNGNGVPDECETDCNGNGEPDDCDIAGGVSQDVNENGKPDECEDCDGDGIRDLFESNPAEQDCDGDGICNGVEIAGCMNDPACDDCNGNGLPDGCETDPQFSPFMSASPDLAPLEHNVVNEQQPHHEIMPAPQAAGTVTLSFRAIGDLGALNEFVRIYINDNFAGSVFGIGANDCPASADTETLDVDAASYNGWLAGGGGNAVIRMEASFNVDDSCSTSFIAVIVSYETAEDCDGNNIPDVCDPDCNNDGTPDACETDPLVQDCDDDGTCNGCEIDCAFGAFCDPLTCGGSGDCNVNSVPDECDLDPSDPDGNGQVSADCNNNLTPDECDISVDDGGFCEGAGCSSDCQLVGQPGRGIPDECDVDPNDPDGDGFVSDDCDANGTPDECEPDCQGNNVVDACDLDPTDPDGNGEVSPDCNATGVPDECETVNNDCNGNEIPDECDIDPSDPDGNGQVSADCNADARPDECDDTVVGEGARYLGAFPVGTTTQDEMLDRSRSYALQVFDNSGVTSCGPMFVDANGLVVDVPMSQATYQTPEQWCIVHAHGETIIPSTDYLIEAIPFDGQGTECVFLGTGMTFAWGDTNNDGLVDLDDVLCVLDAFGGTFSASCTLYSTDMAPLCAAPNQLIDLDDILVVLDAFGGATYPCPDPCLGGSAASNNPPPAIANITLSPATVTIAPGGQVNIEVYLSDVPDLRAYQMAVEVTGGTAGSLTLDSITVDTARTDYVFSGLSSTIATDPAGKRAANALEDGGVGASAPWYLATFGFVSSNGASGAFQVNVRVGDILLRDSADEQVGIASTSGTTVTMETVINIKKF